jgi:basic membrane lipoprotein Med (substrate-binding protein (PBP1-ABC) superfamily)
MWLIHLATVLLKLINKEGFTLGAISDQNKLAPETVLASFVLDAEKAFDQLLNRFKQAISQGKFLNQIWNQKRGASGDGIVYISSYHNLENAVPKDIKERLEQLKAKEFLITSCQNYFKSMPLIQI